MNLPPPPPPPPARRFDWRYGLGIAIFVAFVVAVEWWFGWARLLVPWRSLAPAQVFAAAVVVYLSYGIRALRLYDYFRTEMRGAYPLCLRLFLQHNMLNNLMPMRSGELSFPWLMARYFKIPPIRSLPVLLWFRLLDLHTLLAIGLLVVLNGSQRLAAIAGLVLWLGVPLAAYHLSGWLRGLLGDGGTARWRRLLVRLLASLPQTGRDFWASWCWTWLNWLAKLGAFSWVLVQFLPLPVGVAWMGVIAGDLTSVLPVHGVAGAGTFEAGVVAGLAPFGVAPAAALPAAVNLHLFLLGCAVFGGLLTLLVRRRR